MVYSGAKYLRFIAHATRYGKGSEAAYANATGKSLSAQYADKAGYSASMQAKASAVNGKSAYSVAQSAASLTNQSVGNIGFTYE